MEKQAEENLIIIGGAEDKCGDRDILKELLKKVDVEKEQLSVITTAAESPEEVGPVYKNAFRELGVLNVNTINIQKREEAYERFNLEVVRKSSIIYFSGGDQLRLTSLLGGTPFFDELKIKYKEGSIFAGTSAGASVMSDTMIVSGPSDESPKKCTLKMAPGFGFIKGVLIDMHFAQRGRLGRLLCGVAENPECIGIGIDENTAIFVGKSGFRVIGKGAVYVVDGRDITDTNVTEQYPEEVLSIYNVKLNVLKSGDRFNFLTNMPIREKVENK